MVGEGAFVSRGEAQLRGRGGETTAREQRPSVSGEDSMTPYIHTGGTAAGLACLPATGNTGLHSVYPSSRADSERERDM